MSSPVERSEFVVRISNSFVVPAVSFKVNDCGGFDDDDDDDDDNSANCRRVDDGGDVSADKDDINIGGIKDASADGEDGRKPSPEDDIIAVPILR